jgi:hypothetical protein
MRLFTYLFGKGFTGGPDFSKLETFRFDLDGAELNLTLPKSNVSIPLGEININFPFRSPGWFENHCEQLANHFYVSVFGELWCYSGPFWKVLNEPFGVLDIHVAIKRTPPDKTLDISDIDSLAEAIRWDYEKYFEVEEPGEYGRGGNREARQEAEDEYNSHHPAMPEEHKLRQKEAHLRLTLRELPNRFEARHYGEQDWLYYALKKEPAYPAHYYCQPLDDQYYLYVRFGYRIDFRDYFHIWQADAEVAEQRMIELVKLTFPNRLQAPDEAASIRALTP